MCVRVCESTCMGACVSEGEREREQGVKVCERDGCSNPLFSWTRVRWNLKLDHETTKQLRRKKEKMEDTNVDQKFSLSNVSADIFLIEFVTNNYLDYFK